MTTTFQFQTSKTPRFQYRRGDCPICNGQRRDCRENTVSNTIHCRAEISNPPGNWGFIGQDRHGFNMWRQDQGDFAYVPPTPQIQPVVQVLSIEERDIQFRQISKHSGLSQAHQEKLAQRQLSKEAIATAHSRRWLWSWQRGERIPGVSAALPGVDKFGKLRGYRGFAIGIPNVHGRILGAQIKPDQGGGYVWLSSTQEKNRTDGSGPQLPNGEIPLGVYARAGQAHGQTLDIAEGYLKPLVAAERFGLTVLGCAGGNWANSPEQLLDTLKTLNIATVILNPDAGAIANRTVCAAYERLHSLLDSWGYSLQVRWWGQVQKSDGDLDEIDGDTVANAKLIAWSEFEFLALRHGGLERESKKDKWLRETQAIQAELSGLRVTPTVTGKGPYIDRNVVKLPNASGLILLQGPMGIGKTATGLHELVTQHRDRYPDAFRGLFVPRNMLGYQSAHVLGLPHHTHIPDGQQLLEVTMCLESWWKLQLHKFPKDPPLIIFDEASQIFEQLIYGHTCGHYHVAVLNRLRELLRYAKDCGGWVVLSEDGLSNVELDLIQEAAQLELVEYFRFEKDQPISRTYTLYDASSAVWQEMDERVRRGENLVLASDSCHWLQQSKVKCQALGINPDDIYILDSKSTEESWAKEFTTNPDRFIQQHQPRILGYSPTAQSGLSIKDASGHFNAMALYISHLHPRISKQLVDRLRSDVPRFGYVKKRGASDTEQFSASRPATLIKDLYRKYDGIQKLTDFAKFVDEQDNREDLLAVMADIKAAQDNPSTPYGFWFKYWSRYRAREHWGKLHLREQLVELWQSQGHRIQFIEDSHDPELARQRKAIREILECEEAIAVAATDTEDMSVQDALTIMTTLGSTVEERRTAKKRLLQDRLPGCPLDDPDFLLKTTIQHQGRFLKATELLWLSQYPAAAQMIDRWSWSNAIGRAADRNEMVWLPSLSTHSAQAKLMSECPLQPFIEGKIQQWDNHTKEAIAVHQWAYFHRHQFRRYLRLDIKPPLPEDCPKEERQNYHTTVQVVNKLLKKLGLLAAFCGWKGSRGDRQRQYQICNLEDHERNTILESLTARFLKRCETKDTSPPISLVIASGGRVEYSASGDHGELDLRNLDLASQVEFSVDWQKCQTDDEKQVILDLLQWHQRKKVS